MTLFIVAFGATYWGILGIAIVLLAGLVLLLFVRLTQMTVDRLRGRISDEP